MNQLNHIFFILLLFPLSSTYGQSITQANHGPEMGLHVIEATSSGFTCKDATYSQAQSLAAARAAAIASNEPQTIEMNVGGDVTLDIDATFIGDPGGAIPPLVAAIDVWSRTLESDFPVRVQIVFADLDPGILGSAGPNGFFGLFGVPSTSPAIGAFPAIIPNTGYPVSIIERLVGFELNGPAPDLNITLSTGFLNSGAFYFGTDGNTPPDQFDLFTIILHELCHGLGFVDTYFVDETNGRREGFVGFGTSDLPSIFDRFVSLRDGFNNSTGEGRYTSLLSPNMVPSDHLPNFLTTQRIFYADDNRFNENTTQGRLNQFNGDGLSVNLFSPNPFRPGSSIAHFDEATFNGTIDALMTPFIAPGEFTPAPGPQLIEIMLEQGWSGEAPSNIRNQALEDLATGNFPFVVQARRRNPADNLNPHLLQVYPNPFSDQAQLFIPQNHGELAEIHMYNAAGQEVILSDRLSQSGSEFTIDLSSNQIPSGLYILQVQTTEHEPEVLKIMKQ